TALYPNLMPKPVFVEVGLHDVRRAFGCEAQLREACAFDNVVDLRGYRQGLARVTLNWAPRRPDRAGAWQSFKQARQMRLKTRQSGTLRGYVGEHGRAIDKCRANPFES